MLDGEFLIEAGWQTIRAVLVNNAAAQDLVARLTFTIDFMDLYGRVLLPLSRGARRRRG